jgi:serine/threonine-protein kinase
MALAVAALGIAVWRLASAPRPVSRAVVTLPPADRLGAGLNTAVAISADGTRLVYAARRGTRIQLYLRRIDQLEAAPMPGTEDAAEPFFSPDGEWVGFFSGGKLKKVLVTGGAALTLCDATAGRGAAWGPDDTIVFSPNITGSGAGLWRVSANGGTPQELTKPDAKNRELSHRWPQFLPGGKAVLFTAYTGGTGDESRIAALRLDTGERRTLFEGATYGRYIPTGHLVYARAGGLLAAPFDPARLQVTGRQFPILEGVRTGINTGVAQFAFSDTGSLASPRMRSPVNRVRRSRSRASIARTSACRFRGCSPGVSSSAFFRCDTRVSASPRDRSAPVTVRWSLAPRRANAVAAAGSFAARVCRPSGAQRNFSGSPIG